MTVTGTAAFEGCIERAKRLADQSGRRLLGIVGSPGAGKSTLAEALEARLPGKAVVVPMDGFHLANVELARLGRAGRKGAPDTFDSAGFVALLHRLRAPVPGEIIYAPLFRREIEEPIASAIPVLPDIPLVVVEGNYLLLKQGPWAGVRAAVDEMWFVDIDPALRHQRLVDRHIRFGRTPAEAEAWVAGTDEPNARLIDACRPDADLVIRL